MFLRFNAKVGEKSEFRGKFVPGSELAIPFGTNCERGFGRIASKHRVFKGKLWNLWHTGDNTQTRLKLLISFSCKDIWIVTVFFSIFLSFSFCHSAESSCRPLGKKEVSKPALSGFEARGNLICARVLGHKARSTACKADSKRRPATLVYGI